MTATKMAWLAIAIVCLGSTFIVRAQPGPPPGGEVLRAQVRARVRALNLERLARVLALDPQTTATLGAVWARYDEQISLLEGDNARVRPALQQLLRAPVADVAAINLRVDQLLANRARIRGLEEARGKEVRKRLSPAQYARLLLALPRIKMQIQREIFQAIRRPQAAPADDNLDEE